MTWEELIGVNSKRISDLSDEELKIILMPCLADVPPVDIAILQAEKLAEDLEKQKEKDEKKLAKQAEKEAKKKEQGTLKASTKKPKMNFALLEQMIANAAKNI